jgi:hypothetical protein
MGECADALQRANEAHAMASVINAKHESHEATCARRYQDWRDSTDRMTNLIIGVDNKLNDRVSGIYKILWTTSGTTILTLLGAVGAMAFFLLTKK